MSTLKCFEVGRAVQHRVTLSIEMGTKHRLSCDSDIPGGVQRLTRRESVTDYITNRRGSLSDLIYARKRDSIGAASTRMSRHPSLTSTFAPLVQRDAKQRSTSLSLAPSQPLARDSRADVKNVMTFIEKRLVKTRSLNCINSGASGDDTKRPLKQQFVNASRRRKWLAKIKTLQRFDSVIKHRQNRMRFDVSKRCSSVVEKRNHHP